MPIVRNEMVPVHQLPGFTHRTVAGPSNGLRDVEVWMQTLAPGAATPVHRHNCEEVIVVLRGSGVCTLEGEEAAFGPDSTLIVPPNAVHALANTGSEEMVLVATLAMAPVRVETADGERIPLPWDQ